ncbi:MAG: HAD-IIA family hydrolase [Bacillota bacterium]
MDLMDIECFLLDMDGTFYLGNELIDGALKFINILKENDKEYIFLTNNSSRNTKNYQVKLKKMGVEVKLNKIINSGEVTADYIKKKKNNALVYVVGTPSLEKEFENRKLEIVKNKNKNIDFLVLGFDTTLNYEKLWDAHDLILEGTEYIATNPDYVCPLPENKSMPDCGSIIKLLETSTGKKPLVIGKPNTLMIEYVSEKTGIKKDKMAMIGDRLYTDIQTAHNAEITSILVLSGETKKEDLKGSPQKPDYIFDSLKQLSTELI